MIDTNKKLKEGRKMSKIKCELCPHQCQLKSDQVGFCQARANINGRIVPVNYGLITAMSLDPIEKKPLAEFYPGSKILSIGSFGCNLRCPFCQNYNISMADIKKAHYQEITPEKIAKQALDLADKGNIGLAYTYNEPLIAWEFVRDCAIEIKKKKLQNVLVTNGCFSQDVIRTIRPLIDAANIDLKAFTPEFYTNIKGDLEMVKESIALMAQSLHVEVTTLIVPGENDDESEMKNLSRWLASVDKKIPFHISRFFPRYEMVDKKATEVEKLKKLAEIAGEVLESVYLGNC